MDGALSFSEIQKIVEANMRDIGGMSKNTDWQTEFPSYDSTGEQTGTITSKGLQGLRDVIAQSILDVLTFKKASGSVTTSGDGSNTSPPSLSGNNSKIRLEISGDVELKGTKTNLQDGGHEVT